MRPRLKQLRARTSQTVDRMAAGTPVPAGVDGSEPPAGSRASARERGTMRRRLRRLKQRREALLLELGALVFELERRQEEHPDLVRAKVGELLGLDEEAHGLGVALDSDWTVVEVVRAGIAGACPRCGALVSLDAAFCSSCGAGVAGIDSADIGSDAQLAGGANGGGSGGTLPGPEPETTVVEEPPPPEQSQATAAPPPQQEGQPAGAPARPGLARARHWVGRRSRRAG